MPEKKKVEKVVQGAVVTKDKSLSKKFSETFLGDDLDNVKSYIFLDVFIPAVKNTISEIVSNGIEMLLFGRPKAARGNSSKTYVSYNSYSKDNKRENGNSSQNIRDFRDIILETRGEAEDVLSNLSDLVVDYGFASVADLYDLCGISKYSNFTDNKYGWVDLRGVKVKMARGGGYLIDLPRAVQID